jgi:DNA-directed RNA polymerase omega subunit
MVEQALYRRNAFDRAFHQIGNKYAMVDVLAKRALDLANGSPPMIKSTSTNLHIVAAEEIALGKIRITLRRKHDDEDDDVA